MFDRITASPFEQFQIFFFFDTDYFQFTNAALFLIIVVLVLFYFFTFFLFSRNLFVKNIYDVAVENLYSFTYNIVYGQLGNKGSQYIPFFQFVFLFLLFANLIGLLPYSCALTSHFNLILSLSFLIFLGIQYIGISDHGLNFLKFFLPKGTPLALSPFIILIEFISYVFRVVSISIRIIANILSGHILLKILSSFAYNIYTKGGFFFFVSLIPLIIVVALSFLEMFVCVLQAYVYTILSCIYLKDVFYIDTH
uniref:ATP synthase subunit a n=1 Tax=Eukaryota sp. BB2 TaxID=1949062 RepID=A0A1X8VEY8_9EUKA|nr:ATP synthase F0 subunit 6 [Eukaryota sp. BB2]AQL10476.1 ATP synthase F0 subunit 6 [Eukaryota sp. BB2]